MIPDKGVNVMILFFTRKVNLFFSRQTRLFLMCLFTAVIFLSCGKAPIGPEKNPPRVQVAAVEQKMLVEEVSGFGSLSFVTKVDITASQDGAIRRIYYREGTTVPKGALVAELENPHIELAVGRAENAWSQAAAALKLSRSRLLEGEFNAEAEILGLEKAEAELDKSKKNLDEQRRKALDQEKLYAAGGLSDEAIREIRFGLAGAEEELRLMEMDMAIRTVGLRDEDLRRTGLFSAGGFTSEAERRAALVRLSTSTLRAEMEAERSLERFVDLPPASLRGFFLNASRTEE
jgi:multidrug efflux pump subunit AcrA (membrane-fusion protein)